MGYKRRGRKGSGNGKAHIAPETSEIAGNDPYG